MYSLTDSVVFNPLKVWSNIYCSVDEDVDDIDVVVAHGVVGVILEV